MTIREWRPLFSERLAMGNMGPIQRWLHVRFSRLHYRVTWMLWDGQSGPPITIRAWFWLWRQYRKTWTIR
jgi:hypothetical protein